MLAPWANRATGIGVFPLYLANLGLSLFALLLAHHLGAVGQPRDGNPKAGYVVYDLDEGTIELRRLDYDWPGAQGKVEALGFPPRGPRRT